MGVLRVKQKHTLFAVVGPHPTEEQGRQIVGVTSVEQEAESLLASGVFTLASEHAKRLVAGGSVSVIVRRGSGPAKERTWGFGSFVMDNPNGEPRSRSWDFSVLAAIAEEDRDDG
jgi:hypothetical protein